MTGTSFTVIPLILANSCHSVYAYCVVHKLSLKVFSLLTIYITVNAHVGGHLQFITVEHKHHASGYACSLVHNALLEHDMMKQF